ncbi:MAG TPA: sulfite exporter TauE/SafE family protein [Clostridia bacterium]
MIVSSIEIFAFSLLAGFLGSLLGLGGGIIIIPALTLIMGVDIKYAIGASIISVIATSSGSAIAYLKDKITNIRVGMLLEMATTTGALTGAFIASVINAKYLYLIFGMLLLYSSVNMFGKRKEELPEAFTLNPLADKLKLGGVYYDKALSREVAYNATGVYGGFGMMYLAGVISGLLGIGSGIFKVLAMDRFMKLPMKVSTATSNFMIGVTAAASSGIYLTRGNINPQIAAPVALGVLIGASVGTKIMQCLKSTTLRMIFIPVLLYVSIEMIVKGVMI